MSRKAFVFGLVVIGILIFSLYRAKFGARESANEIARIEAEIEQAKILQLELKAELSHRARQDWIEEYARNTLGMVPTRAEQFVQSADLDRRIGPPALLVDPDAPLDREVSDDGEL